MVTSASSNLFSFCIISDISLLFHLGDKVQNTKFEFFCFLWYIAQLCLADLPYKFSVFFLFCLSEGPYKVEKTKNGFLFFALITTRYERARQSQQKLQFCILFLYHVSPQGLANGKNTKYRIQWSACFVFCMFRIFGWWVGAIPDLIWENHGSVGIRKSSEQSRDLRPPTEDKRRVEGWAIRSATLHHIPCNSTAWNCIKLGRWNRIRCEVHDRKLSLYPT